MVDELLFVIYDKIGAFQCQIVADGTADFIPNGISVAEFTLDDDDPDLAAITAPGARCAVRFRGLERFRGRVQSTPSEGPDGTVTVRIEGDMRKLWDWHGRPNPDQPLNAQTSETRHYTGTSEDVFKQALAENVARLGVPWTVAPSAGLGDPTVADFRFHPLGDKIVPPLVRDHLVITLAYSGVGAVTVDVREPDLIPGVFTILSGVPDAYTTSSEAPTATRAIVGGRGEGVAREFVEVIDTARESDWADIIETFVDARNTDEGADLAPEAEAALLEGAPRLAVSFDLVETELFAYGITHVEGDLLHVRLGQVDVHAPITRVTVAQSAENGVTVTSAVGDVDLDDPDVQTTEAITRLARQVRDTTRR